jgi:pilus assembly protein CpaB
MKEQKESIVSQLRQDRKIMIIAVICGLVAVVLVYLFLKSKQYPYGTPNQILVAKADITQGQAFTNDVVEIQFVPENLVSPNAIGPNYLSTILDMKALVPIAEGDPILWSYVQTEKVTSSLSDILNKEHNERAVTISIDEISGIGGHILPNDRVDIIGTFTVPGDKKEEEPTIKTKTILQCVTVLAVGGQLGSQTQGISNIGMAGGPITSVTLKVKPEEAELLAFAESIGNLRLLLRSRDDLEVDPEIPVIDYSNLFEVERQQTRARRDYIQIIYGIQNQ